ncbi:MAG: Fic family protein [Rhizobiales bacterium]|nr:Fic family protein [Hyphomicrobiales bacterium]
MDAEDFTDTRTGKLVPTIKGLAFHPNPLPPSALDLAPLVPLLARAERALGELSGIGRILPNPYLLIRPFMRREAVASSKIEGTVTTLTQLLLFEVDEETTRAPGDAREVLNYVRALEYSLKRLDELPISSRMIKDVHGILLTNVQSNRGANIVPGEFRRDQNWIGATLIENARYVPPPPHEVDQAMSALEKYINNTKSELPTLIQLALIHYQFEAIHPFPDGNGRVGRLLIPLILCARKEISQPLLYLSSYFESHYNAYIDHMLTISQKGHWERWIEFFLVGIEETCNDAIARAQALQSLQNNYYEKIQRARSSALLGRLIDLLFEHPAISIPYAANRLTISYNAAKNNIAHLIDAKILKPSSGDQRPMVFVADEVVKTIS